VWNAVHRNARCYLYSSDNRRRVERALRHASGLIISLVVLLVGPKLFIEPGTKAIFPLTPWVSAFAAALGGLDTLVFAGGIGENAPTVRARICDGLGFLGIELDPKRNVANADVISSETSRISVRVIPTSKD
jgi:Acetokinase family